MRTHTKTKQIHEEYNINFYYFIKKYGFLRKVFMLNENYPKTCAHYLTYYYSKQTGSHSSKEQNYEYLGMGEFFRLRRTALHYLFDTVQNEYKIMGFTTEVRVGSLYCYKSDKSAQGDRKIIEILIKVEK